MTAISLTIWNSDHTWFVEAPTRRPSFRRAFPLKLNRSNESPGRNKQKSGCSSFARLSLNRRKIEFVLLFFYFLSIVRNVSLTRTDYFFFCGSYRNWHPSFFFSLIFFFFLFKLINFKIFFLNISLELDHVFLIEDDESSFSDCWQTLVSSWLREFVVYLGGA